MKVEEILCRCMPAVFSLKEEDTTSLVKII
jgi:hypothetical protein